MKDKKSVRVLTSIILICSLAGCLAGCNQNGEVKATDTGSSQDDAGHASVSTVTLTEGKYSEEKLNDTWEEDDAVYLKLKSDKISVEEGKNLASEESVTGKDTPLLEGKDYVEAEGSVVTITGEGTYVFSGTLEEGQIVIDAEKEDVIRLVLNGVSVTCGSSSPLYSKGGNVIVTLAEGTENTFVDAKDYQYENEGDDEPDAAIFAKDDLTFNGTGTLNVTGNYNHGIHCKDDLKFITGTYIVSAADDGIVGKDSVSVKNGNFTIESGDDGIKATNVEESDKGYILIEEGSFDITAGGDGIQAETLLRINDGNIDITTDKGSENAMNTSGASGNDESGMAPGEMQENKGAGVVPEGVPGDQTTLPDKGAEGQMTSSEGGVREQMEPPEGETGKQIEPPEGETGEQMEPPEGETSKGTGTMKGKQRPEEGMQPKEWPRPEEGIQPKEGTQPTDESETDSISAKALKSYVDLIIAGGKYALDSGDDALHGDRNVTIEDGTFSVYTGDDGVHAGRRLTVNGGALNILQSYEGIEGFEIEINGGDIRIMASDDGINAAASKDDGTEEEQKKGGMSREDQGAVMTFNGGNVYVNADGDGLDANGDIFINGGILTVHGPVSGGNGTLDFASVCKVTGGTFTGAGSMGMVQNPSDDSTQPVLVWYTGEPAEEGEVFSIYNSNNEQVAEIVTEKKAQWFAVSSPELKVGETYTICEGDTRTQVEMDSTITQFMP